LFKAALKQFGAQKILKFICEAVIFKIKIYILKVHFDLLCNFYDFEKPVIQKCIIITLGCHINH